jgi:hypothetical protein
MYFFLTCHGWVEDRKAGIAIYAPSDVDSLPFEKRRGKVRSALWYLLNAIAAVIAALIVISFLLPVLFDILQVPSFAIGTDNLWIVRWENNAKGFNLSLGLLPLLAIAAILALKVSFLLQIVN